MSRIGRNPVILPAGVNIQVVGTTVKAKGKMGELALYVGDQVKIEQQSDKLIVSPVKDNKQGKVMWGTARNLLRNLVMGVSEGYSKILEINGVGFRAAVQAKSLQLQVGYSHDIVYPIPADVTVKVSGDKANVVTVSGLDKQRVGQVASEIRSFRPPEPYQGKGIKYSTEKVRRKEGKKK
ncbi:MAG: 50S ribosomal protein L6 [Rhodospirillaceae bacterium]|nr:50S ribosomal protein L6 [Rhodospirillaceae bacterium]